MTTAARVTTELADSVAVVRLCRDVTNPIDLELLEALRRALRDAVADPAVRSLVLSGSNTKFLSIGWDLPALVELDRDGFRAFFHAYNQACLELFTLPLPTVAALRGHAVAGGCLLALACDWRIIAEGRKLMGLNEVKLGVPIPWPGDRILRHVAGDRVARILTEEGEMVPAQKLLAFGLVDQIVDLDAVEPTALELAARLGAAPQGGLAVIKHNRTEATAATIRAHLEEKEAEFLDCWFADETRSLLREAAKQF